MSVNFSKIGLGAALLVANFAVAADFNPAPVQASLTISPQSMQVDQLGTNVAGIVNYQSNEKSGFYWDSQYKNWTPSTMFPAVPTGDGTNVLPDAFPTIAANFYKYDVALPAPTFPNSSFACLSQSCGLSDLGWAARGN